MNRLQFLKTLGLPMFTLAATGAARAALPPPPLLDVNVVYQDPSPAQKRWALAISGMIAEMNRRDHTTIGNPNKSEASIQAGFQNLAKAWSIRNHNDLQRTLNYFLTRGSTAEFDRIAKDTIGASPGKINQLKARYADNGQVLHQMYLVEKFYPTLGAKSLMAFDLGRYVMLCRSAYDADFMTEAQVWEAIYPQALALQRVFSSWAEVGNNYILGASFISVNEYEKDRTLMEEALKRLTTSPQSPWVQLPWNLNLERPAIRR